MSLRAWLRVVALTLALLATWAMAYTTVCYEVARQLSEARRVEKEQQLVRRMVEAGRNLEQIRKALENFDRRYPDGGTEDHEDHR